MVKIDLSVINDGRLDSARKQGNQFLVFSSGVEQTEKSHSRAQLNGTRTAAAPPARPPLLPSPLSPDARLSMCVCE